LSVIHILLTAQKKREGKKGRKKKKGRDWEKGGNRLLALLFPAPNESGWRSKKEVGKEGIRVNVLFCRSIFLRMLEVWRGEKRKEGKGKGGGMW